VGIKEFFLTNFHDPRVPYFLTTMYAWDDNYVILLTTVTAAMLEVLLVASV